MGSFSSGTLMEKVWQKMKLLLCLLLLLVAGTSIADEGQAPGEAEERELETYGAGESAEIERELLPEDGTFDEDRELVSYDEETELERGILRSENGTGLPENSDRGTGLIT